MFKSILLLILTGIACHAKPAWTAEISPHRPGPHPLIGSTTLDYRLSWKGMLTASQLRMELAPKGANKPGMFVTRSNASSLGAASKLFPYTHNFWSEVHPKTLLPRYFHSTESDKKEDVTTIGRYERSKVSIVETSKNKRTAKVDIQTYSFAHNHVHDLFSAMLYIRSQRLHPGDKINLVVMPFKTPYFLRISVLGREKHAGQDAIKLSVAMTKINRDTFALENYKKLRRPATIWLSDDKHRVPLELRAAVFIGDVRAVLTGHVSH